MLLNLARNIFEDTECLDTVVRRIMSQAQELLQCERCTVYILDTNINEEEEESVNFFGISLKSTQLLLFVSNPI